MFEMLTEDREARWDKPSLLRGRCCFRSGDGLTVRRVEPEAFRRAESSQKRDPFLIGRRGDTQWWWYLDRFFRDDRGLLPADVRALVGAR